MSVNNLLYRAFRPMILGKAFGASNQTIIKAFPWRGRIFALAPAFITKHAMNIPQQITLRAGNWQRFAKIHDPNELAVMDKLGFQKKQDIFDHVRHYHQGEEE